MTLFTGSSRVAEKLAADLNGRIKLEDAGFDWKILGPDVQEVWSHTSVQHLKLYILNLICDLNWILCQTGWLYCLGLRSRCLCLQWSKVLCSVCSIHAQGTAKCAYFASGLGLWGSDCGLSASPMMHNLSLPIYKWVVVPVVDVFFGSCLLCNNLVDDRILTTNLIYWSTVFFVDNVCTQVVGAGDSCCRCNCYDVLNFGSYLRSLLALGAYFTLLPNYHVHICSLLYFTSTCRIGPLVVWLRKWRNFLKEGSLKIWQLALSLR